MIHKLLRVRYFSKSSFLDASLGYSPSYTWRSIWEDKKWLREGCRWCIGDGKATHLWTEQWLPRYISLLQESSSDIQNREELVASISDESTGWWNIDKIRTLFNPRILFEIFKVVISPSNLVDKWTWKYERNGQFSVRSCYRNISLQQRVLRAESSDMGRQ